MGDIGPKSSTSSWEEATRTIGEPQRGRISRRQLLALGATTDNIKFWLRTGRLIPVAHGVYAVGHATITHDTAWIEALLRVGDDAVLSHASAAANAEIRRSAATLVDITCPRRLRGLDGIRLHRRALPADEMTLIDGLPTTTPSRTIFDLASVLTDARLEWAIAEAEKARLDFSPSLADLLDRYPRHPGNATLRRVLARTLHGASPLRSDLECEVLDLIYERRWPRPLVNAWLEFGEERFELDFAWPELRLAVEVDSREHHLDWSQQQRDRRRDRVLAAHGWSVVRVTDRMLRFDRSALIADLDSLIYTPAPRRRSSAGRALHS